MNYAKSIFPVFEFVRSNPSSIKVRAKIKGTAFFVTKDGIFLSCAHVFDRSDDDGEYYFSGFEDSLSLDKRIQINVLAQDKANDIFIGQVGTICSTPFKLTRNPIISNKLQALGYPGVELKGMEELDLTKIKLQNDLNTFISSCTLEKALYNDRTYRIEGFCMKTPGSLGMSGGPVVNNQGLVCGVSAANSHTPNYAVATKISSYFELADKYEVKIS